MKRGTVSRIAVSAISLGVMRLIPFLTALAALAGPLRATAQGSDSARSELLPGTHTVALADVVQQVVWPVIANGQLLALCATTWKYDERTVYITSARPANEPVNPICERSEAVVLVRPACVFGVSEFVYLRARAPYVVLLCRNGQDGSIQGVGIPLAPPTLPQQRISET